MPQAYSHHTTTAGFPCCSDCSAVAASALAVVPAALPVRLFDFSALPTSSAAVGLAVAVEGR
jgi:hypothetical protein